MEEKLVEVGRRAQQKEELSELTINTEFEKQSLFFRFFKRIVDIFGSLLGLILLSPVFLIVAWLIYKEDPNGPVIFSQKELENKAVYLPCTNFALCVPMQKNSSMIYLN